MQKRNKTIIIFSFLFCLFFFSQASAQSQIKPLKYANYCTIVKSENSDSTEIFRTKAFMSYSTVLRVDGGDTFFYLPRCNGGDNFSTVDFSSIEDSENKWSSFLNNLPSQRDFIFEVDFTGTIESSLLPIYGHLGWSRAEIKLIKINSIRDVSRRVKKPVYDAAKSIIEDGRSLRDTNVDVSFFILLGNRYEPKFNENISEDFVLTDFTGNTFTKKNLPEFFSQNPFGKSENYPSSSLSGGKASRINNQYKVVGIVAFTNNQDKITSLRYENFFEYKRENWLLTKSNLSIL